MAKVELSRAARSDLHGVQLYSVENFGNDVAARYLADLQQALTRLVDFPKLGAPAVELKRGTRFLPCRQHRIFYSIRGESIVIARILHQSMDPRKWLD